MPGRATPNASGQQTSKAPAKPTQKSKVKATPVLKKSAAVTARKRSGAAQSNSEKPVTRKRPASVAGPSVQASRKRPATVASPLGQANRRSMCKSIMSALTGADELNPKLRDMLSCLTDLTLGKDNVMPPACMEAAITMVREGLFSAQRKLQQDLAQAQARLHEVFVEKETRAVEVHNAEAMQLEWKRTIAEHKVEIKESTNAIQTCTQGLKAVKDVQKASQDKLEDAAAKVDQLRNLDEDLYQPLKVAPVPGPQGRKHRNRICKVGKEFGFQDSLLEQIPKVLKKGLDRRCTFDGLVLQRMESEFSKHYSKLEGTLQDEQATFQGCRDSVQDAQAILQDSVQARNTHTKALAEAAAILMQSKTELPKARQSARKVQVTWERAVRELDLAEARLDAFQSGPLTAFKDLQQGLLLPATSIAEAVEVVPAEVGLKCPESALLVEAVAQAPASPFGDATLTWATTVKTPVQSDPLRAQMPIVTASADPADASVVSMANVDALAPTVVGTQPMWAPTDQALNPADAVFAHVPATDALAYEDSTLAWAPTVKASGLERDDTLAWAPTQLMDES